MAQPPSPVAPPAVQASSSLSFTQGFLLGQLSIALLIFCFIKFFIFGEPPSADDRAFHLASLRRARTLSLKSYSTSTTGRPCNAGGPSIATILAKTYYNVKGHQPESLDWFNVLVAQTIAQLRADARQDGAVLTSLTDLLNSGSKPDWIGEIKVTEIALGDEFPIFSNCRVMPVGGDESKLQARMDVDLSDVITLGIETTLVLNYPRPLVAVLPVALAVSVVRFSGTLAVSFIPSSPAATPSNPTPDPQNDTAPRPLEEPSPSNSRPTTLAFTFLDDYRLDISVRSLVGSRSRLQDVPKIAQLIESRVHAWFDERAVEPRFQQIVLPSLWPRKHNTRGGATAKNEERDQDGNGEDEGIDLSPPQPLVGTGLEDDETIIGQRSRPNSFMAQQPPPLRNASSTATATSAMLDSGLEAEGAKLREAERRAGERSLSRDPTGDGMRWRGAEYRNRGGMLRREESGRNVHSRGQQSGRWADRFSGDWGTASGQRGMPGGMP